MVQNGSEGLQMVSGGWLFGVVDGFGWLQMFSGGFRWFRVVCCFSDYERESPTVALSHHGKITFINVRSNFCH